MSVHRVAQPSILAAIANCIERELACLSSAFSKLSQVPFTRSSTWPLESRQGTQGVVHIKILFLCFAGILLGSIPDVNMNCYQSYVGVNKHFYRLNCSLSEFPNIPTKAKFVFLSISRTSDIKNMSLAHL